MIIFHSKFIKVNLFYEYYGKYTIEDIKFSFRFG